MITLKFNLRNCSETKKYMVYFFFSLFSTFSVGQKGIESLNRNLDQIPGIISIQLNYFIHYLTLTFKKSINYTAFVPNYTTIQKLYLKIQVKKILKYLKSIQSILPVSQALTDGHFYKTRFFASI